MTAEQLQAIYRAKVQGVEVPPDGIFVSKNELKKIENASYMHGNARYYKGLCDGLFWGVLGSLFVIWLAS